MKTIEKPQEVENNEEKEKPTLEEIIQSAKGDRIRIKAIESKSDGNFFAGKAEINGIEFEFTQASYGGEERSEKIIDTIKSLFKDDEEEESERRKKEEIAKRILNIESFKLVNGEINGKIRVGERTFPIINGELFIKKEDASGISREIENCFMMGNGMCEIKFVGKKDPVTIKDSKII